MFEVWAVEEKVPCAEGGNEWQIVGTFVSKEFATKEWERENKDKRRIRRYIPQLAPGGGSIKGSQFERDMGWEISNWLSHGTRGNLCRRTVLSGGQYTQGAKSGKINPNPGDLTANDPLAFPFFDQVVVECKSWRYIELIDFIWKKKELYEALLKVQKEAEAVKKMWMLVVKQRSGPIMVLLPCTFSSQGEMLDYPNCHRLFGDAVYLFRMVDLFNQVSPEEFIKRAGIAHG